jgi:protein YibB
MRELTIVTAFFDIGRDKYTFLSRSVDKYLDHFRFWARMQNRLIVYTSPELAAKVMEIRRGFGLEDRTTVIEIEDVFEVEPKLYEKMKAVESRPDFFNFRANNNPKWPENMANYDYVMLMKYWCMHDAVDRGFATGLISWLDFGFNHGGECFTDPEEFDFLWKCELGDKVHVFCKNHPDNTFSVFQLQLFSVCMMGAPVIVPDNLAGELWRMTKKATEALVMLDCIDDDQQLLLMAYREEPEIFEIHMSDWFMPMKEHGGEHLTVRPKVEQKVSLVNKLRNKRYKEKKYAEFAKRMYEAAKRYQI